MNDLSLQYLYTSPQWLHTSRAAYVLWRVLGEASISGDLFYPLFLERRQQWLKHRIKEIEKLVPQKHWSRQSALIGSWFQPIRWRYYLFCCRVRLPLTGSQFSPAGFLSGPWKARPPLTARVAVSIAKTSQGRRSRQEKIWHRLLRLRKVGLRHLTSGPYVNWP